MILENTIREGNLFLSQAEAKNLVESLYRAVEVAADHQTSHPAVTFMGNSEKEKLTIWVSPK